MYVVGIDLGGTKILARLVDPVTGKSAGRVKRPTPKDGVKSVLDAIAEVVAELEGSKDVDIAGLGVPGPVDPKGLVGPCPNIKGWDKPIDIVPKLERRLKKRVVVANDANCGAVAEHRVGVGRGFNDMLAVFVGTGVGAGLILDGSIIEGDRGLAGELGHLTVRPGGRKCGCGERGHLEAYAGRHGIEREAQQQMAKGRKCLMVELAQTGPIRSRHIEQALDENDKVSVKIIDDAIDALALGIGNVVTLLDISCVVLGGGVVDKLGDPFLGKISESKSFGGFGPDKCELRLAQRIDDAVAVGAAILGLDRSI